MMSIWDMIIDYRSFTDLALSYTTVSSYIIDNILLTLIQYRSVEILTLS